MNSSYSDFNNFWYRYTGAVAVWYSAGLATSKSLVRIPSAAAVYIPTPTQRAIPPGSLNEYQRKLRSKRAYHAMHHPRIRGLAASAGVRLRAMKQ